MDDFKTLIAYSRRNAMRRLVRCLFAENILDRAALSFSADGNQATYPLKGGRAHLAFSEIAKGPADTIVNDGDVVLVTDEGVRQTITSHQDMLDVLRDSFDFAPTDEGVAGLKADMENSLTNDAHARQHRQQWNARLHQAAMAHGLDSFTDYLRQHASTKDAAILLDQWGSLEGHPYYPTWKARPGFPGRVILITDGPDLLTLPTMSYRTMMPVLDVCAPLIKLPIAVWMTSELRSLQAKSIHMGPRISTVISQILQAENGFDQRLEIFPEEIGVRYKNAVTQDDHPGRHLSVVYRASAPAFERADACLPITVASLFTRLPGNGRPLFTDLIERDGVRATAAQVENWYREYAKVVTHPVVAIYLLYGIGLEAHQQNTMVLFSADGKARSLLIRDFGDGRTYAPLLEGRGYSLQPHVQPGILPTVFSGDIEPVRMFVLDAAFLTHLHELALWLTKEYGLNDTRLWHILREETDLAFDAVRERVAPQIWETEHRAFVEDPWPTRSLLRMHLMQYSNYRLQHTLTNPLASV